MTYNFCQLIGFELAATGNQSARAWNTFPSRPFVALENILLVVCIIYQCQSWPDDERSKIARTADCNLSPGKVHFIVLPRIESINLLVAPPKHRKRKANKEMGKGHKIWAF